VVDDDGLLVVIVHLAPHPELLKGVEPVERGRPLGVLHGHETDRAVAAGGTGDDAAGLVRVILAGMVDDLLLQRARDRQHDR
jgi:hypothetical protein